MDKFREECGLMGVWCHKEAANMAYLGLYAQQHRGQEGAGVVSVDGEGNFHLYKGLGLVADVFKDFDFRRLPGEFSLGHVRYTTAGGGTISNVQPFTAEISLGKVAVAHNGNLINADQLRAELIKDGAIFGSTSDTEVFLHLLARSTKNLPLSEVLISSLKRVKGAYSLIICFADRLFAIRDPGGLRPLCLGSVNGSLVVASETCAFDLIGAKYIRDIEAGEILEISGNAESKSYFPFEKTKETPCIFEYVYFARPDSNVFGRNVYAVRKRLGAELAKESKVDADFVIPVPDSGVTAALGYAEESKIPFEMGLIRNHYVGRTFIEPKQSIRDFGVKVKLNPNHDLLKDKSVIVIDDSLVRGTTAQKLVKMLRTAGAREIHFRVSSPPTIGPCYYGIDTPSKDELIACRMTVQEIQEFLAVDSLAYLSLDGLFRAVNGEKGSFCSACFSNVYPIGRPEDFTSKQIRLDGGV